MDSGFFSGFDPWFGQAEANARRIRAENRRGTDAEPNNGREPADDGWDPENTPVPGHESTRPDPPAGGDTALDCDTALDGDGDSAG